MYQTGEVSLLIPYGPSIWNALPLSCHTALSSIIYHDCPFFTWSYLYIPSCSWHYLYACVYVNVLPDCNVYLCYSVIPYCPLFLVKHIELASVLGNVLLLCTINLKIIILITLIIHSYSRYLMLTRNMCLVYHSKIFYGKYRSTVKENKTDWYANISATRFHECLFQEPRLTLLLKTGTWWLTDEMSWITHFKMQIMLNLIVNVQKICYCSISGQTITLCSKLGTMEVEIFI